MNNTRIKEYLEVVHNLNTFTSGEIDIIKNILIESIQSNTDDYVVIDERINKLLAGFVIFGKIEWTVFSWELYWIIVRRQYQRQGTGKALLDKTERFILSRNSTANIVAETSSAGHYTSGRSFLKKYGFIQRGLIPDFFNPNDDLITFSKEIKSRQNNE